MIILSMILLVLYLLILSISNVHSTEVYETPSTMLSPISPINTRSREKDTPKNIFISSFIEMAHSSSEIVPIFSIAENSSPEELSKAFYEIPFESPDKRVTVDQNPVSCRNIISDVTYHVAGHMTLNELLFSFADFISTYILSQKLLGFDNATDLSSRFGSYVLESVHRVLEETKPQRFVRVFCNGLFKFMVSLRVLTPNKTAAMCISMAKKMYSVSGIWSEAKTELFHKNPVSKWDTFLASLPSASDASGLNSFRYALLESISNSPVLKQVLHLNLNLANSISDAWYNGILDEATQIGSLYPEALARYIDQVMLRTSAMMTSNDYNKALGNGWGMYLLSQGLLNSTSSEILASRVSDAMEKFSNIPNGGSVVPYVSVVINGFREFHASYQTLVYDSNSIAAFVYYLSTEYFLVSGIKEPNTYF